MAATDYGLKRPCRDTPSTKRDAASGSLLKNRGSLSTYWLPKFLQAQHDINLGQPALPLIVVYVLADGGSIAGGWLSSQLIKKGWQVYHGRMAAMLVCALAVVPIMFARRCLRSVVAVALVSLAASAHQGWSANLFTTTSDMSPRKLVGSVVGIGGFAGAVGGYLLECTGNNYTPMFIVCGLAYLGALGVIQLLAPNDPRGHEYGNNGRDV